MAKYTIQEIDALRSLCTRKFLFGKYRGAGVSRTSAYTEREKTIAVEEQIRTLIAAGLKPKDIHD